MNYIHLKSWYYQGKAGEANARDFFEKLKEGTKNGVQFPFDCPYEVALVHCSKEEHWCVGILVLRGTPGDDSREISETLMKWYDECKGDPSGADKDTNYALRPSVEGTLRARYGSHYRSVEVFGNIPDEKSAQGETSTIEEQPSSKSRQKFDSSVIKKKWWQFWK